MRTIRIDSLPARRNVAQLTQEIQQRFGAAADSVAVVLVDAGETRRVRNGREEIEQITPHVVITCPDDIAVPQNLEQTINAHNPQDDDSQDSDRRDRQVVRQALISLLDDPEFVALLRQRVR